MLPALEAELSLASSSVQLAECLVSSADVPPECRLWGDYSPLSQPSHKGSLPIHGYMHWQSNSGELEVGCLVSLGNSPDSWRVMELGQAQVCVMRSRRERPTKLWLGYEEIGEILPQTIPVYSIHAPSKSVRAFGEMPVSTVMLIHDSRLDDEWGSTMPL